MKQPETVFENHGVRCPECGRDDELDVTALVDVRLTSQGSDADASDEGSHEWDDNSLMHCCSCGHRGTVSEFQVEQS